MALYPSYLNLLSNGELDGRVRLLLGRLGQCIVCPRHCRVKRLRDMKAVCNTGRRAEVASWCVHRGEEPCISGQTTHWPRRPSRRRTRPSSSPFERRFK